MPRRLGQHFLKNETILKKIAGAIKKSTRQVLIEIGPGHGELTKYLFSQSSHLILLERDHSLVEKIKKDVLFSQTRIIEGDALVTLPSLVRDLALQKKSYSIIGNIPYYITGQLLRAIGDISCKPQQCVFLIQNEVAQRICAKAPRMNLLAAIVGAWASARILMRVSPGNFFPPPSVDSAVIVFEKKRGFIAPKHLEAYYAFVKTLFKQPRKTLLNNLIDGGYKKDDIIIACQTTGLSQISRPGECELETVRSLFFALTSG